MIGDAWSNVKHIGAERKLGTDFNVIIYPSAIGINSTDEIEISIFIKNQWKQNFYGNIAVFLTNTSYNISLVCTSVIDSLCHNTPDLTQYNYQHNLRSQLQERFIFKLLTNSVPTLITLSLCVDVSSVSNSKNKASKCADINISRYT